MLDSTKPIPHQARIDAAIDAAQALERELREHADELGADGAQPHLLAALGEFESAIRAGRTRLATRAAGIEDSEQQALAV